MTWIGVTDHTDGWFSLEGAGGPPDTGETHAPDSLLPRGTLLVETRLAPENRPQTLLAFRRSHPWAGTFSLQALPGGSIVLIEAQGNDTRTAVLPCPYNDRTDIVRITYSWDAPGRTGRLSIERPQPNSTHSVDLPRSRPMVLEDLREIMLRRGHREMDREVTFAAVSDKVEPVGPMPGLTAQTPLLTSLGEKPVHRIRRGDLVITDRGEQVPVLHVVRRTVPARGSFHPIRLRAGYFGLTRDIAVSPNQKLVMRGSDVEYMFGREAVLVPARHLLNNVSAFWAKGPEMVTYYQVLLPGHDAVIASGCALSSLLIGRIRRKPEALAASVLAGFDRARLPEHAQPAWPILKPFEAITLASSRAA